MAFRLLLLLSAICALYEHVVVSSGTYIVALQIPGGSITGFLGTVAVPSKPETGPLYISAGIEDSNQNNSLSMRLDGTGSQWALYSTWESMEVSQSSQGNMTVSPGDTINFSITYDGPNWISTLTTHHGRTTSSFNLGGLNFSSVGLNVQVPPPLLWNFTDSGIEFNAVTITQLGSDSSWCTGDTAMPNNGTDASTGSFTGKVTPNSGPGANLNTALASCAIDALGLGPSDPQTGETGAPGGPSSDGQPAAGDSTTPDLTGTQGTNGGDGSGSGQTLPGSSDEGLPGTVPSPDGLPNGAPRIRRRRGRGNSAAF